MMSKKERMQAYDNHSVRRSAEYMHWKKNVLARDDYTCQVCGSKGDVEAHHLYDFESAKSFRLNPNSGTTLCRKCHEAYHKEYVENVKINPGTFRRFKAEKNMQHKVI